MIQQSTEESQTKCRPSKLVTKPSCKHVRETGADSGMYYLKPETTNENEKSYEAKCVFGENGSTETIISTNTKSERLTSGFERLHRKIVEDHFITQILAKQISRLLGCSNLDSTKTQSHAYT